MTTTEPKSVLARIIEASAARLAQDPRIPDGNRLAFQATAAAVMHGMWAQAFGGEVAWVRLYVPRESAQARQQRRARILAALAANEAPAAIARRESVSERWVQKLRRLAANSPCMESSPRLTDHGDLTA